MKKIFIIGTISALLLCGCGKNSTNELEKVDTISENQIENDVIDVNNIVVPDKEKIDDLYKFMDEANINVIFSMPMDSGYENSEECKYGLTLNQKFRNAENRSVLEIFESTKIEYFEIAKYEKEMMKEYIVNGENLIIKIQYSEDMNKYSCSWEFNDNTYILNFTAGDNTLYGPEDEFYYVLDCIVNQMVEEAGYESVPIYEDYSKAHPIGETTETEVEITEITEE